MTVYERGVLLLLAVAGIGGPVYEMLVHGPVQGCRFVFAGIGWGCS